MILLDTNICIYIINNKSMSVLERFRQYRHGEVGICSIVAAELSFGVAKSGSQKNRDALQMFLAPLVIMPFDEAAALVYGDLKATMQRTGQNVGPFDLLIAAHALSQNSQLITNNMREFAKVPGLLLDNWAPTA